MAYNTKKKVVVNLIYQHNISDKKRVTAAEWGVMTMLTLPSEPLEYR